MDKFIRTYDGFDEKTCKSIIEIFENSDDKDRVDNGGVPNFTQVNLGASGKYDKFMQLLCYKTVEVLKKYNATKEQFPKIFRDFLSFVGVENCHLLKY